MHSNLNLSDEQNEQLKKAIKEYALSSQLSFSLDGYINKWIETVGKVRTGYPLGIYDYTNELSRRDILEDFLSVLSIDVKDRVYKILKPIDETFLNETEETLVPLTANESVTAWWWHRIPKNLEGELKDDIQSLS